MSCDPCAKGQLNLTGGLADGKKPEDFDAQGLLEGTQHEMEHTGDPKVAQRIAMDHLTEDKEYYRKLKKIETTKSVRGYVKSSLDKSSLDKSHPVVRRITVQELPISIETDKGQYRERKLL